MKVNKWINQKFWQSIFIRLGASIEYVGGIGVHHQRCLRRATPKRTAKLCVERI
ncbi:MAG: hypothetical protein V7K90_06210 [Nostoc sp.]|uniref:hypothetical protein n=1 Tax=Nostoc sp. TaxID=1180 RepID=UPI002FF64615